MELDLEAQPAASRPPAEWAGAWGRKNMKKIWPKVHLTMYANVGRRFEHCDVILTISVYIYREDYGSK